MVSAQSPKPNLAWCHDAVDGVSRTFALTIDLLEEPMSSHICVGYLLCRVADTVEDAGHIPPGEQVNLLRTYDAALDPDGDVTMAQFRTDVEEWLPASVDRDDDWSIVAKSPTIWATFTAQPDTVQAAVIPPVREMVDGMAMFVERYADTGGLRIGDRHELERYCHYAAGTVGTLITNLLTRGDVSRKRTRVLYETAEEFGFLLQLVNVAKDVYDDYTAENNVYLPAEWLDDEGIDQDAVVDPCNRESAARVVHRTATYAETFLDDAQTYLETMPLAHGNTMAAWTVPYLLGVGTLRELNDRPADALTESGVAVSREEVFAVVEAASAAGRDSVTELRATIARNPYHHVHE